MGRVTQIANTQHTSQSSIIQAKPIPYPDHAHCTPLPPLPPPQSNPTTPKVLIFSALPVTSFSSPMYSHYSALSFTIG